MDATRQARRAGGKPVPVRGPRPSVRSAPLVAVLALVAGLLLAAHPARADADTPAEPVALESPGDDPLASTDDYDPWQPFNERTFAFNHRVLDRFVLKPAARAWDKVVPDVAQRGIGRAFDNLDMPRRVVNNFLQLRPKEGAIELTRFAVNTTAGVLGFIDVAEMALHLEQSDADMGQTLGVWGVGAGPYLVLPFLPPLTVRDGIGRGVDSVLDPFGFLVPFVASTSMSLVKTVNDRSLNLQTFADLEEGVLDLYSAVRNGYLQRRRHTIEERRTAAFGHRTTRVTSRTNHDIAAEALAVDGGAS